MRAGVSFYDEKKKITRIFDFKKAPSDPDSFDFDAEYPIEDDFEFDEMDKEYFDASKKNEEEGFEV